MPSIDDYRALAPFTLDELVAAVNSVLRDRPAIHVQARTVRYYIAQGLVPSPAGGPKYARYAFEHLQRIVAIRTWLDEGVSLDEARKRLSQGEHGGEPIVRTRSVVESASPRRMEQSMVRRIRLTPVAVLEVEAAGDDDVEVERALIALQEYFRDIKR